MNSRLIMNGDYKNHVKMDEINHRVKLDPKGFVDECEWIYSCEIEDTAQKIADGLNRSRIVMLAGPSGSGKTTSARLIRECLAAKGIKAHTIEMDSYFLDVDRSDMSINYETPDRLDLSLMIDHMEKLAVGETVMLPKFDFVTGKQIKNVIEMHLGHDEVAIFEGIHALNDIFRNTKAEPIDIYVSVRMRITDPVDTTLIEPEQMRFIRRGIRDLNYRGSDFMRTLTLWPNVLWGEKNFIMPFKKYADIMIDTSFDYEVNLFAPYVLSHLKALPAEKMNSMGMGDLSCCLSRLIPLDPSYVPFNSMLREFIGELGLEKNS